MSQKSSPGAGPSDLVAGLRFVNKGPLSYIIVSSTKFFDRLYLEGTEVLTNKDFLHECSDRTGSVVRISLTSGNVAQNAIPDYLYDKFSFFLKNHTTKDLLLLLVFVSDIVVESPLVPSKLPDNNNKDSKQNSSSPIEHKPSPKKILQKYPAVLKDGKYHIEPSLLTAEHLNEPKDLFDTMSSQAKIEKCQALIHSYTGTMSVPTHSPVNISYKSLTGQDLPNVVRPNAGFGVTINDSSKRYKPHSGLESDLKSDIAVTPANTTHTLIVCTSSFILYKLYPHPIVLAVPLAYLLYDLLGAPFVTREQIIALISSPVFCKVIKQVSVVIISYFLGRFKVAGDLRNKIIETVSETVVSPLEHYTANELGDIALEKAEKHIGKATVRNMYFGPYGDIDLIYVRETAVAGVEVKRSANATTRAKALEQANKYVKVLETVSGSDEVYFFICLDNDIICTHVPEDRRHIAKFPRKLRDAIMNFVSDSTKQTS